MPNIISNTTFQNTPFSIGGLTVPNRLIQAPLAGISCAPFRALFNEFQAPGYAVSEMVSAHSVLYQKNLNPRYLTKSPKEALYAIQLSGAEPELIRDAVTQIIAIHKPNLIDLNCGCPKPKIRAKGCGSALLENPLQLEAVVRAMREASTVPITVKIRLSQDEQNALKIARIVEQAGADALIVHGRTYQQDYDTSANYSAIRQITRHLSIPVIANGDVKDIQSMQQCFEQSHAAALMIGRGSIGRPWLFQSLLYETDIDISYEQRCMLFEMHIRSLAKLEGLEQTALQQARRLLKWYFPMYSEAELSVLYQLEKLPQLFKVVSAIKNSATTI